MDRFTTVPGVTSKLIPLVVVSSGLVDISANWSNNNMTNVQWQTSRPMGSCLSVAFMVLLPLVWLSLMDLTNHHEMHTSHMHATVEWMDVPSLFVKPPLPRVALCFNFIDQTAEMTVESLRTTIAWGECQDSDWTGQTSSIDSNSQPPLARSLSGRQNNVRFQGARFAVAVFLPKVRTCT